MSSISIQTKALFPFPSPVLPLNDTITGSQALVLVDWLLSFDEAKTTKCKKFNDLTWILMPPSFVQKLLS